MFFKGGLKNLCDEILANINLTFNALHHEIIILFYNQRNITSAEIIKKFNQALQHAW